MSSPEYILVGRVLVGGHNTRRADADRVISELGRRPEVTRVAGILPSSNHQLAQSMWAQDVVIKCVAPNEQVFMLLVRGAVIAAMQACSVVLDFVVDVERVAVVV